MDISKYNISEIINNIKSFKFFTYISKTISCLKIINDGNIEEYTSKTTTSPRFKRYHYRISKNYEISKLECIIGLIFITILILFLIYIFIKLISSFCKKRRNRVGVDNSDGDSDNSVYVHPQMTEPNGSSPYAYFIIPPPPNYPPPPNAYCSTQVQRSTSRRTSYPPCFYLVPCQPPQQSTTPSSPSGNVIPSPDNNDSNPPQTTSKAGTK